MGVKCQRNESSYTILGNGVGRANDSEYYGGTVLNHIYVPFQHMQALEGEGRCQWMNHHMP